MKPMQKPKNDVISDDMRVRLLANRNGKLTIQQYKDVITAPLATLLVLLAPLIVILGARLAVLTMRGLWIVLLVGFVVVVVPLVLRARRYARAPVHFAVLNAGDQPRSFWQFWKPQIMVRQDGVATTFRSRLAPYLPLRPNQDYVVYYLEEIGGAILLSLAPADHPDAGQWQPTSVFQTRFKQRSRA
jgi:hypothetical protein